MEKIPSPKELLAIWKRLTPEQRRVIESRIADVFAKGKNDRYLTLLFQADAIAKQSTVQMTKYLARACPRCKGYVDVMMRKPGRDIPLQAVNGRCVKCGYRLAWIVIRGGQKAVKLRANNRTKHIPPGGFL